MTERREFTDRILRFDPSSRTLVITEHRLPYGLQAAAAVRTDVGIFLFGGRRSESSLSDRILHFDPGSGEVKEARARLPTGRYNLGAVWSRGVVFLFGGFGYRYLPDILRYDPRTDTLEAVDTALPSGREAPDAFEDGESILVVGGHTGSSVSPEIVRFHPSLATVEVADHRLPFGAINPAPIALGGRLWRLGGASTTGAPHLEIVRVDPLGGAVFEQAELAAPRAGRGTAATGEEGFVFGGIDPVTGKPLDTILRFAP